MDVYKVYLRCDNSFLEVVMINRINILAVDFEENAFEQSLEEKTLEDYVKNKGFLNEEEIYSITANLCDDIETSNSLKATYRFRELKPSNIIVASNGKVTLLEYDITYLHKVYDNKGMMNMTSIGYTSSKQYRLAQFYKQKDILNIGLIMYFMATGKFPYTILQPLMDESYGDNIDVNLKRVIQKCFQNDDSTGYASIEELKRQIIIGLMSNSRNKNAGEINSVHSNIINVKRKKQKKENRTAFKNAVTMFPKAAVVILSIFYSLLFERKAM